jgi:hypothetical protein
VACLSAAWVVVVVLDKGYLGVVVVVAGCRRWTGGRLGRSP